MAGALGADRRVSLQAVMLAHRHSDLEALGTCVTLELIACHRVEPSRSRIYSASPRHRRIRMAPGTAPGERRMMLFETIRVGGGHIVAVRPKSAIMALVALTWGASKTQTGGPDRIRTGDLVLDRDVC